MIPSDMGKCLTIYMFSWAIIVFVQAFLKDWAQFMVFRFLQGAFEVGLIHSRSAWESLIDPKVHDFSGFQPHYRELVHSTGTLLPLARLPVG